MNIKFTIVYFKSTGDIQDVEAGKVFLNGVNIEYDYFWTSEEIADVNINNFDISIVDNISVSNISEITDKQYPV